MVRSIVPRCEQIRGTQWPNKVALLIGTRVAKTILASGPTSRTYRPDIWVQAIRSNLTKLLCHGGRPHMGPGSAPQRFSRCALSGTRDPRLLAASSQRNAVPPPGDRFTSPLLTIFWRCSCCQFSSRNGSRAARQRTVNGFARGFGVQQGLAMLIRGQYAGISKEVAVAAATIPAASLPTLLLGGLLLSCP